MSCKDLFTVLPFGEKNDHEMLSFECAGKKVQRQMSKELQNEIICLLNHKLEVEKEVADLKRENKSVCATFNISDTVNKFLLDKMKLNHKEKSSTLSLSIQSLKVKVENSMKKNDQIKHSYENEMARHYYLRSELRTTESLFSRCESDLRRFSQW